MIVVCTDYMEHTDVVSVQLSHFQVCIGTCKFFYFAFSGLTSNTCCGVGHACQYDPFSSVVLVDYSGW